MDSETLLKALLRQLDHYLGTGIRNLIMQERITTVIGLWAARPILKFRDNPKLTSLIHDWILDAQRIPENCGTIERMTLAISMADTSVEAEMQSNYDLMMQSAPKPVVPGNLQGKPFLSDFQPAEVARQLTLISYNMYKQVTAKEFYSNAHSNATLAPHIHALGSRFDKITAWVDSTILSVQQPKQRRRQYKWFQKIILELLNIHNWHDALAIHCSLLSGRMAQVRELMKKSRGQNTVINEALKVTDNYKHYRRAVKKVEGSFIPILAVILRDLTTMEETSVLRSFSAPDGEPQPSSTSTPQRSQSVAEPPISASATASSSATTSSSESSLAIFPPLKDTKTKIPELTSFNPKDKLKEKRRPTRQSESMRSPPQLSAGRVSPHSSPNTPRDFAVSSRQGSKPQLSPPLSPSISSPAPSASPPIQLDLSQRSQSESDLSLDIEIADKKVNFNKIRAQARVMSDIERCQVNPPIFWPVPFLRDLLQNESLVADTVVESPRRKGSAAPRKSVEFPSLPPKDP